MKGSRFIVAVVVALIAPLLTGCWDRLEIENRGTVVGLSIDPNTEDDSQSVTGPYAKSDAAMGYKLTFQVAIPGQISLGPGQGGSASGPSEQSVWLVTTTGKTIDDAMSHLQQQIAEKVFLGHLRVIIVNENLAKSVGLRDIQDFFRRNAEIRRLAWLIISAPPASKTITAAPKLERVPALYIAGTMQHAANIGKIPNIFLGNYWSVLSSHGQEPVLPMIRVIGQDRIESEGLAIFKGQKLVGKLDPLETASFMELTNNRRAGYGMALPVPGDPLHSVIVRGTNRKERVKFHLVHGKLSTDVYSRMEANIEESTGPVPVDKVMREIETNTGHILEQSQTKLIKKTQALGVDIVGYGEFVRGRYPEYWLNEVGGSREQWDKAYSHLSIHPHVKVYLRRSGMSAR